MRWVARLFLGFLVLVVLVITGLYLAVRGSLPSYDGEVRGAVTAAAELTRDDRGYLSVKAANRIDAAHALGYGHAQDRFFQMDMLRRGAAGELSALLGAMALPADKKLRIHRFRARAELALAALPQDHRKMLEAYTDGINEGLASLSTPPFEYLALRQMPKPWRPADSLLTIYFQYLFLQRSQGYDEIAMGVLKDSVPEDWYKFLTQPSTDWQAAVDGSRLEAVPLPKTPWPFRDAKHACSDCTMQDDRTIGSNNFAVSGALSLHGAGILANDTHLNISVPGAWYKTRMSWVEGGKTINVTGVTLPGMPNIVIGSNGKVAWGFTNTEADWTDVIAVKFSADGTSYQTPSGPKPLLSTVERIEVAGAPAVDFVVKETEWGPLMAAPFEHFALRWVAHDVQGLNMRLIGMEQAGTVDEAVRVAAGAGIPAQNLLVADAGGRIGWTVMGAIPLRHLVDMDTPQDWSTGVNRWSGYIDAASTPRLLDPGDGRLWTANARPVGGESLALMGSHVYDLGARAQQIRDDLRARSKFDEAALHEIQLDHRALFLQHWRQLLLDKVLTPEFVAKHDLAQYRDQVVNSADAARADAVGYRLVREFRLRTLESILAPMASLMESRQLKLRDLKLMPEQIGWTLIQAGRPDSIPAGHASWTAFLQQTLLDSRDKIVKSAGDLDHATWGDQNRSTFRHPLSKALPFLNQWIDLPSTPLTGDAHMPRVQLSVQGQSERMVVAPGHEDQGILTLPGGQSGHPLSPYFRADHEAWLGGRLLPFLPGPTTHKLVIHP